MGCRKNKKPTRQQMSACRALVPIDGAPIRKKAFAEAAKTLKKIDRLEKMLDVFEKEELDLFKDWELLTFRAEKEEIEFLNSEHHRLAKFHNWILAESKMKEISVPHAHHLMKAEEKRYRNTSSAKVREEIELLRAKRDQYIAEEIRREFEQEFQHNPFGEDFPFGDEDDGFDDFDDEFDNEFGGDVHENPFWGPNPHPLQKFETHLLKKIEGASDQKIKKLVRHNEECLEILGSLLALTRFVEHLSTFLRVWDLAPRKYQREFVQMVSKNNDTPFDMVVEQMREVVQEQMREASHKNKEAWDSNNDGEAGVTRQEDQVAQETQEDKRIGALQRMKGLFRRLVQRLHPDYQGASDFSKTEYWKKRLWLQIQDAHKEQDHLSMEKLYLVHQLRAQQLDDLSVSEIQSGTALLEQDLSSTQKEVNALKHSPAWGFSRKRSFTSIEKRLRRDYHKQRERVQHEVESIRDEHHQMEMIYQMEQEYGDLFNRFKKQSRRRRPQRKSSARKKRAHRNKAKDSEQQMSFF